MLNRYLICKRSRWHFKNETGCILKNISLIFELYFLIVAMSHEKEFDIFLSNWNLINRSVKLSDVVDSLIEKGIISEEQWSDLKKAPMTESERMDDFMINFIQKGDRENLNVFRGALKVNGFPSIAEILEGGPGKVNY